LDKFTNSKIRHPPLYYSIPTIEKHYFLKEKGETCAFAVSPIL